jgi:hypothetical protein
MLADGIEAASRTIHEPTTDRIQGLVQKMVNKVFASGELEECELTLKELHEIARCFTRVLSGIYHSRITYSEPAEKTSSHHAEDERPSVDIIKSSEEDTSPQSGEDDKKPKEDLKRLGI